MRKTILILVFIALASCAALAQDKQAPKANDKPIETKPTEKAKPIILDKAALTVLENLSLKVRVAQLEAENAIPANLKEAVKTADTAISDFWKALGVPREMLGNYDVSDGVDGAKILTKKEAPKPALTVTPSKAEPPK